MNIQNISLSDIHPYARNPRKNDEAVKNVAASIREFGFLVPLVIDRNHEIVAGHTRYKAAKSLGMKEVPCVIADELTEDQIKAFRLVDNKVGELAEWDVDLLPLELADIVMPMADFGFETISDADFSENFTLDDGENNQQDSTHLTLNPRNYWMKMHLFYMKPFAHSDRILLYRCNATYVRHISSTS